MNMRIKVDLAILGAVTQEVEPLTSVLNEPQTLSLWGETVRIGMVSNLCLLLATTGFGKVNAALTTAALLERFDIAQVWNVGCAGAYAEGPLQIGDVLVTDNAICGDEGILTPTGLLSPRGIGIPIVIRGGEEFYDYFPLEHEPLIATVHEKTAPGRYKMAEGASPGVAHPVCPRDPQAVEIPNPHSLLADRPGCHAHDPEFLTLEARPPREPAGSFQLVFGPSVTVSMVSGDMEIAGQRFRRYGAFAENMEGSGVAQACFRFDIPVLECRGISNIAGERRKEFWQMKEANAHCHGVVLNWLEGFTCGR